MLAKIIREPPQIVLGRVLDGILFQSQPDRRRQRFHETSPRDCLEPCLQPGQINETRLEMVEAGCSDLPFYTMPEL